MVVVGSVVVRFLFAAPVVWGDDVRRLLLLAVIFLGAAAALAGGENAGVVFFVERLQPRRRAQVAAMVALVILLVAVGLCWYSAVLLLNTSGQTVGAGVPQELFFAPMCFAPAAMTVFASDELRQHRLADLLAGTGVLAPGAGIGSGCSAFAPDPPPRLPAPLGCRFAAGVVA